MSRILRSFGFGLGLETFANFWRVLVSVLENLVSEKKASVPVPVSISEKVLVSVSVKILVSSFSVQRMIEFLLDSIVQKMCLSGKTTSFEEFFCSI